MSTLLVEGSPRFRETYRIPANVSLKLIPLCATAKPDPTEVMVPLVGICIGGIQSPLPQFGRGFFNALNITTSQLSLNVYQVVFGVAKLIRCHEHNFRSEDFFGIYFVGQNAHSRKCYLSRWLKKTLMILELPDKDDLKDVLIVGGTGSSVSAKGTVLLSLG